MKRIRKTKKEPKETKYRRITWTDRLTIEKLRKQGASCSAIARQLGFAVSSIHYEIQRGLCEQRDGKTWKTYEAYSATVAQDDADWQATARGCTIKLGHNHVNPRKQ